ncbi:MAG: 4'-phosphopantetheinyl transferase superfamily protein [Peptostreptococcaceae bacterium]|nr:4'-phosphopantetheinyl transferase superfamily protein [Peptostreptococcaceae bacterium]
MNIYLYEGEKNKYMPSETMLKKALKLYNIEYAMGLSLEKIDKEEICKTEKGKPYFNRIPLEFSISHSMNIWVCTMGIRKSGIDIQAERAAKIMEIAKRFFATEELEFLIVNGTNSFFQIWSMKESFVKFTGEGISYGLNKFSVVKNGKIIDATEIPIKCTFQKIKVSEHYECYVCSSEKENIWIRDL